MGNPDQLPNVVRALALWSVPTLAAVIAHEIAHGLVALWRGDDTALRMGRLTLNPLPHIDPYGTVLLPAFLVLLGAPVFGYARPVPVNFTRLRHPRSDMVLVAIAGPMTNVLLAAASALLFRVLEAQVHQVPATGASGIGAVLMVPLAEMAYYSVVINAVLAVFNLLPIPPLDGGRVLTGLLPYPQARLLARVEPFGIVIVAVLLMTHSLSAVLHAPLRLLLGVLL